MSLKRFKEIRAHAFYVFADIEAKNEKNKWWPVLQIEKMYRKKRKEFFKNENKEWITDKSMSAFRPRTSPTADLPHLQKVKHKPKQLGTELKTIACCKTGVILSVKIQKGKQNETEDDFSRKYGKTAGVSCCLINLLKETDETKSESTDDDGTNMLAAETEREESVFTDFPEMSQTQDIVEVGTQVEDVREMYEEEEANSVIFDLTEEPLPGIPWRCVFR